MYKYSFDVKIKKKLAFTKMVKRRVFGDGGSFERRAESYERRVLEKGGFGEGEKGRRGDGFERRAESFGDGEKGRRGDGGMDLSGERRVMSGECVIDGLKPYTLHLTTLQL